MAQRVDQPVFSGGEVGDALVARTDTAKVRTALRRARNVFLAPSGGAYSRPGLEYVSFVYDSSSAARLIPFQFSIDQAYAMEMGNQTMRLAANGGLVLCKGLIVTGITKAAQAVVTCASHGYAAGDDVFFNNVNGMVEINGLLGRVVAVTTNTYTVNINTTGFSTFTSVTGGIAGNALGGVGGYPPYDPSEATPQFADAVANPPTPGDPPGGVARVFKLATPYAASELATLGYKQAADVVVFAHLNHPVQKLVRYEHGRWSIGDAAFGPTVPTPTTLAATASTLNSTGALPRSKNYRVTSVDPRTGEESFPSNLAAATNDLTLRANVNSLTWDAMPGVETYNVYSGYTSTMGYIGSANAPAFFDEAIAPDYSDSWPVPRYPFSGAGNYPAAVAFFQQRSVFGRTLNAANLLEFSQSGALFNFTISRPSQATDGISLTINAERVNAITHLVPLKDLVVFTSDAVWSISGQGGVISPDVLDLTPQGYRGASRVRPVPIDEVVLFNPSMGASIRTLNFQFEADGYKGNDLTVFAPHLFENVEVVDMAWAEFPTQTVFVVCDDGDVRVLTWMAEQEVWGWSKMTTPGGAFESVCVISEGGEHVPYFIVRREVSGFTYRYIERLTTTRWAAIEDAFYVDSGRRFSGSPRTVVDGLDHLEGEEVVALADGAVVRGLTVSGGQVTLPRAASEGCVGLNYEAWIRTLPLPAGGRGRPKAIAEVAVSVVKTRGIAVGLGKDGEAGVDPASSSAETYKAYPVKARDGESYGQPPRLRSETLIENLPPGTWAQPDVVVIQRDPLPMHVTAIEPAYELGGDA